MTEPRTSKSTIGQAGTPSDEQLAGRVGRGCVRSYEELDRRYRSRLVYLLAKRTGSREDAEDLTQQALLRAYERIDQFNPSRSFKSWLFTIAVRLAIDAYRKRGIDGTGEGIEQAVDPSPDPAEAVSRMDTQRRLWALADKVLDPTQRTALWLHYGEQLKTGQIAKVLGISAVHVRVLLFRARRTMMANLEKSEREPARAVVPEPVCISKPVHPSAKRVSRPREGAMS